MKKATGFGIDLGTTDSAVAVLTGTQAEVVRNNENQTTTPSAVWVDESGGIVAGRTALERHFTRPEEAAIEFQRLMGNDTQIQFPSSGHSMTPEELSAEVLRSLKANVLARTGMDLEAAVITVPAWFSLPQRAATDRAATIAGITRCMLLEEPIAQAMACGFHGADPAALVIVCALDQGGFDVAVIQSGGDTAGVLSHGGDRHLGTGVLEWAVVEELLIPAVEAAYDPPDFARGNPRWKAALAKLKSAARDVIAQLSRCDSADVRIDYLGLDGSRNPMMDFICPISLGDVERLMDPIAARAARIVRRMLNESKHTVEEIHKLLFLGDRALMSRIRKRLADSEAGTWPPAKHVADPDTAAARGAAIFAGSHCLQQ